MASSLVPRWFLLLLLASPLFIGIGFLLGGYSQDYPSHSIVSTRIDVRSRRTQLPSNASIAHGLYTANKLLGLKVFRTYDTYKGNMTSELPDRVAALLTVWRSKTTTVDVCRLDVDVLAALAQIPPNTRYMFVANLKDNEAIMPHFAHQLVTAAQLLPGASYISLYESGSTDNTNLTLAEMKEALGLLQIPHTIVWDGHIQRKRDPLEDRIAYLARLRNAALAPMYRTTAVEGPQTVIFLNDVLFCANDVLRLVLLDADLACGLDFQHPNETHLYDIWVLRDIAGNHTAHMPHPYLRHPPSAERMRKGLPTPVHCCWNALAVVKAEPFYRGLRIRSAREGECRASECSLMCDDLHRMGYRDVLLDPSVRVAYNADAFRMIHSESKEPLYHPYDAKAARRRMPGPGSLANLTRQDWVECCPLPQGKHHLDWDEPKCYGVNIMEE